jgi:hypothetical protein
MIGRFFAFLWSLARLFPAAGVQGVRYASGASILLSFLFFVFFAIGLVLVLFGFDLAKVDLWLDRNGGVLNLIGTILFKIVLAGILLICALVVLSPLLALFDRSDTASTDKTRGARGNERTSSYLGMGCAVLAALAIGYFCFVGLILQ